MGMSNKEARERPTKDRGRLKAHWGAAKVEKELARIKKAKKEGTYMKKKPASGSAVQKRDTSGTLREKIAKDKKHKEGY